MKWNTTFDASRASRHRRFNSCGNYINMTLIVIKQFVCLTYANRDNQSFLYRRAGVYGGVDSLFQPRYSKLVTAAFNHLEWLTVTSLQIISFVRAASDPYMRAHTHTRTLDWIGLAGTTQRENAVGGGVGETSALFFSFFFFLSPHFICFGRLVINVHAIRRCHWRTCTAALKDLAISINAQCPSFTTTSFPLKNWAATALCVSLTYSWSDGQCCLLVGWDNGTFRLSFPSSCHCGSAEHVFALFCLLPCFFFPSPFFVVLPGPRSSSPHPGQNKIKQNWGCGFHKAHFATPPAPTSHCKLRH